MKANDGRTCSCGPSPKPTKVPSGPCGTHPPCGGDKADLPCQPCAVPEPPCQCRMSPTLPPCGNEPCAIPPCEFPPPMLPCPPVCTTPSPVPSPSPSPKPPSPPPPQPSPPKIEPTPPTPISPPHPPPYCPVPLCSCLDEPDYDRILAKPCKTPCSLYDYSTMRWNCSSPDMCTIMNPCCYRYCDRFASIYQKDFCRCSPCGGRDVCILRRPPRYDWLPLGKCCGPKFEYLGKCGPRLWGTELHGGSGGGPKTQPCFAKMRSYGIMGPPPSKYCFGCTEYQSRHSRLGCMLLNYGKHPCNPRAPPGYPCPKSRPISPCGNALCRSHNRPLWLSRR